MDFLFYVTVIVGLSLTYNGYELKKKNDVKLKEIELEKRKLDLELKKMKNTESTLLQKPSEEEK